MWVILKRTKIFDQELSLIVCNYVVAKEHEERLVFCKLALVWLEIKVLVQLKLLLVRSAKMKYENNISWLYTSESTSNKHTDEFLKKIIMPTSFCLFWNIWISQTVGD